MGVAGPGKISWFGGPHDPGAQGTPASGTSIHVPGISLYNHATLGGYFLVKMPNGRQAVLRQTDIGPAPWTGRKYDFTYSALPHLGYSEHNFPTDATINATYLGKSVPAQYRGLLVGQGGTASPGGNTKLVPHTNVSTSFSGGQQDVQAAGAAALLKAANRPIATNGTVQTSHLLGDLVANLASGAYTTPSQANTQTSVTQQRVKVPGGKGASATVLPGSSVAGGFLPKGSKYVQNRKDQGRDGYTNAGGAIIAPGAGYVVRVGSDPSGFGPRYPIVHFTSGRYAGRTIYLGHTLSVLGAGAHFSQGQVLSHTGTHGVGNATVPGWFEIGYADSGTPGPWGQPVPF